MAQVPALRGQLTTGALVPARGRIGVVPYDTPAQGPYDPPSGGVNPVNPSGSPVPASFGPIFGDSLSPYALIGIGSRAIGTIIPDVVVEEVHTDTLRITDHPVEMSAAVTDHAFHLPYELQMRIGFSDSSHQVVGFVQMVYQTMIALQQTREPMNVSTGKRQYQNMLIQSMSVTTDETSEFALNMTVSLREIIITYVQQTSGQSDTPSQTTPQKDAGNTTPKLEDNVPIPPSRPSDLGSVPPATGGGTSPTPPTWEPGDSGPPPPSPPPPIVLSPDPSLPNPDQPWQSLPPPAPPSAPQMGPESPGVGILPGTSGSAESPAPLPPGVITTDPGLVWGGT